MILFLRCHFKDMCCFWLLCFITFGCCLIKEKEKEREWERETESEKEREHAKGKGKRKHGAQKPTKAKSLRNLGNPVTFLKLPKAKKPPKAKKTSKIGIPSNELPFAPSSSPTLPPHGGSHLLRTGEHGELYGALG